MSRSPRGTKRPHTNVFDPNEARPPEPDWSPRQPYGSPPLKMPMPFHPRTAGILRSESPLIGQHLRASSQTPLSRTSATLSRNATGTPTYTFGSSVSLDPGSLPPVPDPVALAEIKRMVPQIQSTKEGLRNVGGMIEALGAYVKHASNTSVPGSNEDQKSSSDRTSQDILEGEFPNTLAGSAFDAFLNDLEDGEGGGLGIVSGNTEDDMVEILGKRRAFLVARRASRLVRRLKEVRRFQHRPT
ncbi:hypothetical protein A1O7_02837 [Cladophialophora yegresii CBS 114405]|uniref:Uncharacterized protein n=1 Tax=Cladophialophora yegresii CBS 114405 TaxID=1182544 RepID=W9W2W9_9EURO|nr:uncharacterized protein A1O7_02837 [Cladophialophora yegresii CBS 114405]EXJ62402.1 hypothetical protein A1O7_02837 [Cladophialophora yegresii CBS 114405]